MSAALGDPVSLLALFGGVLVGYVLFQRRWARPWAGAYRATSERFAARVTRAAELALRPAVGGGIGHRERRELEAFYSRWLNLPHAEREAHREALRRVGIDMIRLGDALRRLRDELG